MRLATPFLSTFIFTALSTGLLACGADIRAPDSFSEEIIRAPLLQFQGLTEGMSFTLADDVDAKTPGLQVRVSVWVNDEQWLRHIPVVKLMNNRGEVYSARTRNEGFKRIATFDKVGVATQALGLQNNWLVFLPEKERTIDDANELDSKNTDFKAEETLSITVMGRGDMQFPFACGEVIEVLNQDDLQKVAQGACTVLSGNLDISKTDNTEIPPMPGLVEVQGDVRIFGNSNLRRLDSLLEIGRVLGDLRIVNNEALPTEEALRLVQEIGEENIEGRIYISGLAN